MKKSDLIRNLSSKTGISKGNCGKVINAFLDEVIDALKNDDEVMLFGFGKFETREYKERKCFNPASGEIQTIKGSKQPCFRPGTNLRAQINRTK